MGTPTEFAEYEPVDEAKLAAGVDWREKNAVTKVKNQGQCGSCWAFSATGSLEGADAIADGKLLSYSEQQLVDCDRGENKGCGGGDMGLALAYSAKSPLETESDYPYKGRKLFGKCEYEKSKGVSHNAGSKNVTPKDVAALTAAIDKGPVSVAIEADKMVFQLYTGGILNSNRCGHNLDHGVLAVGYASDYFIVKNSWGATWG